MEEEEEEEEIIISRYQQNVDTYNISFLLPLVKNCQGINPKRVSIHIYMSFLEYNGNHLMNLYGKEDVT